MNPEGIYYLYPMYPIRAALILLCLIQAAFYPEAIAQSKAVSHSTAHSGIAGGQTANPFAAIDKKARAIPDTSTHTTAGIAAYINGNFSGNNEKARAIFAWIASHIQYDVANMYTLNFYEKKEDKIAKALTTGKGVCENYAALFTDICTRTGIRSFVVEGYTKKNGADDYIGHAWNIAFLDTAWYLFDPTWGAGYVTNGKFYPSLNNAWFKTPPAIMIKTHIPFDYLWQCSYKAAPGQEYFNYTDSIAAYEKLDTIDRFTAAASRIEKAGVKNNMTFAMLGFLRQSVEVDRHNKEVAKQNLEIERQNTIVSLYNAALVDNNRSINTFNAFIDYYNHQFQPEKPDAAIQAMLDDADTQLRSASARLDLIKDPPPHITAQLQNFRQQASDLRARIDEQQAWLKKYFSKGKMGRRSMFRKYTWFGVPLN